MPVYSSKSSISGVSYDINYSGGSNYFDTSVTTFKLRINNYAQYGTYCRTSGSYGGTY